MIRSTLRHLRFASLALMKGCSIFDWLGDSRWRGQRLLILCYHSISLDEEHLWRPATYMDRQFFKRRLELLSRSGCTVLRLEEAVERLYRRDLPPRSVVLTFDDGTYDFYLQAFPLLKYYGLPATVYQTTYYCDYDYPVFHLICSYMLWKRRGEVLDLGSRLGLPPIMDLRKEEERQGIVDRLAEQARQQGLTEHEKDRLAQELASLLGIDYGQLIGKRILQLMRPAEIAELVREGVDFQLHTHRHRTPLDETLFRREIHDNRQRLQSMTGAKPAMHFCYPSGVYEPEFLPWLWQEGVISATTCDPGLASVSSNPLLLPRFIDTTHVTRLEFEGWLSGTASLMPHRRNRPRRSAALYRTANTVLSD
jgi:peptidoglycan/xylan/chitin deacetylase (PgdA/CDA1 family)